MSRNNQYTPSLQKAISKATSSIYETMEVVDSDFVKLKQVHEDAITTSLLKQLYLSKQSNWYMHAQNREVNEARTGVDIELWIGENDQEYIRCCIQAKSFRNHTRANERYDLDQDQCNKLIAYSERQIHQYIPLYFFYQHLKEHRILRDHFYFLDRLSLEDISVTMSTAYHVKNCIECNLTRFSDIHANSTGIHTGRLLDKYESAVSLPLRNIAYLTPSSVKEYYRRKKLSCMPFFFFFGPWMDSYDPKFVHRITKDQIMELYGKESHDPNQISSKNLVILNHFREK